MAKITISDITAAFASTTSINAKFQQLEDELNDKVLYRDNPAGEDNTMSNSIDMSTNTIINLGAPAADNDAVRRVDLSLASFTDTTLPSQSGNEGKHLGTDGTTQAWVDTLPVIDDKTGAIALTPTANTFLYVKSTDGGVFKGVTGAVAGTYSDDGGSYCGTVFLPSGGDGSTAWVREFAGAVNTAWFGTAGDGVTDDTASIQAAIAYHTTGSGSVYIPDGTYLVTSTILIDQSRVHIYGAGVGATHIDFEPTANDTCFLFENDNDGVLYQGSFRHISFFSNDTTYTKTVLEVIDCSGYILEDLGTIYPHMYGAGSTFAHFKGRELCACSEWYAFADRPIVIDNIPAPHPAANIGCDHHNFHNMYLGCGAASGYHVVEVLDGVLLTSLSFTGYQAWIGGEHGFYWNDTTSTAVSSDITFNNVRFEQGVDATKYLYYISHNHEVQNVSITGGRGGDRAGIYLRTVSNFKVADFYYTSATLEAFNVDATVSQIKGSNCFWQAGSTATVAGQQLIFSTPKNPNTGALPPNFIYDEAANAATETTLGPSFIGETHSLADNAAVAILAYNSQIFVSSSGGGTAQFVSHGASAATTELNDWGTVFSNTKDNAGTTNIYFDTADYYLQNKTGGLLTYKVTIIGS
jgi:hypothetical protein